MTYIGCKIPKEAQAVFTARAWLYLRKITLDKIVAYEDEQDTLTCVSCVADVMYDLDTRKYLHSESNDGYSVTYNDTEEDAALYKTALQYLPYDCIGCRLDVVGGL